MESNDLQPENTFEVFEMMEPQELKAMVVDQFLMFLQSNPEACGEEYFPEILGNVVKICRYCDNPAKKEPSEILVIVNAHEFSRLLMYTALDYLGSIKKRLPEPFLRHLDNWRSVLNYMLHEDK
jgi:hypothetical protein